MNPYEELGVPKDATPEMAKRARRKLARKLHPDRAGGDAEKMARVNLALDILCDPARRAQFDQTGQTRVHTDLEQARKILINGMMEYLQHDGVNVPAAIIRALTGTLRNADRRRKQLEQAIARLTAKRGEVETDEDFNLWASLVDSQIAQVKDSLTTLETEERHLKLALEIAKHYRSGVIETPFGAKPPSFMESLRMAADLSPEPPKHYR
jgi:curved DNA-binding protein CbpA